MTKIKTETPKGMRDFLPEEMIKREYVMERIKKIFEKYGFDPLETPAVEYAEVLTGKYGEDEKLIYKFFDKGNRELALRYDLTVPLARVMAANPNLPKPFKRYHISRVWRYDRPQKGRYKEFWQCDIDTIGSKSMKADAELIAVMTEVMKELGFKKFTIQINNRKLLNGIMLYSGLKTDKIKEALISLDKINKVGKLGVIEEMKNREIKEESINKIMELMVKEGSDEGILAELKDKVTDAEGMEGLKEMEELLSILKEMGIDKMYKLVLSLARGLDYYTGTIFETVVEEPSIGSLTGGGRYDTLIGRFSNNDLPAVGTSFGIERIIDVMKELRMGLPEQKTKSKVFAVNVTPDTEKDVNRIVSDLRAEGISAQSDLMGRPISKQIKFADSLGIPFVVIVGPDELKEGMVKLKDMKTGTEENIKVRELAKKLGI
ncbi:histidine--tRNA ligase [Candidatus Woesearchaeota archaeon]|nr:histidine--tRNA ligase [Candidatus Woesearchaeota archaeon]